jgi:hypothetical protein
MTQPTPSPFASEPMMNVRNVSKAPIKFVLMGDGDPKDVHLDTTTWARDEDTQEVLQPKHHPPLLFSALDGEPVGKRRIPRAQQVVRARRELRVEIPVGESRDVPLRFWSSFARVTCELCRTANSGLNCRYPHDPEHRKYWVIVSGGLCGLDQIEVDFFKGIPIDSGVQDAISATKKAGEHNNWGKPKP